MVVHTLATTYLAGVNNHGSDWNPKNIPLDGWISIGIFGPIFLFGIFMGVRSFFPERKPKFAGGALTGTAQVLSARDTRIGSSSNGSVMSNLFRIKLRVQIPGHEPYDVKVWHNVAPWNAAPRPGDTVPVQVAAAKPRKVRIDFSQPVTPQPGSSGFPVSAQLSALEHLRDRGELTDAEYALVQRNLLGDQGSRVGPIPQAADLLVSGQRVPGVLMSFAANGDNTDSTYSRPELRYAPYYLLTVELHIPNLAPMTAKNIQPVPSAMVPRLALGLPLTCAVDPADPAKLFAVDWGD